MPLKSAEPCKIKVVELLKITTRAEREQAMSTTVTERSRSAGYAHARGGKGTEMEKLI